MPFRPAGKNALGGAVNSLTLKFLLAEDFGEDKLISNCTEALINLLHSSSVNSSYICHRADDIAGVEILWSIIVAFWILICHRAVRIGR